MGNCMCQRRVCTALRAWCSIVWCCRLLVCSFRERCARRVQCVPPVAVLVAHSNSGYSLHTLHTALRDVGGSRGHVGVCLPFAEAV
jgi:hypothetical protein